LTCCCGDALRFRLSSVQIWLNIVLLTHGKDLAGDGFSDRGEVKSNINFNRDRQDKRDNGTIVITLEPLAKRLSSRKASIRDPDFQVFTDWIPAKSLPE
jgi:hypothetical protein